MGELVNPEMLVLAREASGHTTRTLSDVLGVSQTTISRYESGLVPVPDQFLAELADKLSKPVSYFYRSGKRYDASGNFHRKRASLSVKTLNRIHARINEFRLEAASLLQWAEVETENRFHRISVKEFGSPSAVARELRRLWQIPSGPIRNVTTFVEGAGGVVFNCDFESGVIDGVSQWPIDDDSMPPIMFINENLPGDRYRFTISHELGHVIMHHLPSSDLECEADEFASEFLMPAADIRDQLENLTIEKAADLKSQWKVSISAIIRRAKDLRVISSEQYTALMKRMSYLGFRKCEPVPIPVEQPRLFKSLFDVVRVQEGKTDSEICEILSITVDDLLTRFGRGANGLRLRFA